MIPWTRYTHVKMICCCRSWACNSLADGESKKKFIRLPQLGPDHHPRWTTPDDLTIHKLH